MAKRRKEITKKSFFRPLLDSGIHLNLSAVKLTLIKAQFSTLINNMYDCKKRLFLHLVYESQENKIILN